MEQTIFQKRFLSKNKKYYLPVFGALLLSDIVGIILLCISGVIFKYIAVLLTVTIVDAIFCCLFYFSNPRLRYSAVQHFLYQAISLLCLLITSVLFFFDFAAVTMTISAWIILVASHLVNLFCLLRLCALLKNDEYHTDKKQTIAVVGVSIFTSVFYLAAIIFNGYFGQANTGRALVFKYDDIEKTYTAVEALEGYGKTIHIPETFNGKPVSKFNCEILNDSSLKKVIVDSRKTKLEFYNIKEISYNANEIEFLAPSQYIDEYKAAFYDESAKSKMINQIKTIKKNPKQKLKILIKIQKH